MSSPERILIQNARLFPMTKASETRKTPPWVDGDLAIAGGKIVKIGAAPEGFRADTVLDVEGAWVLPGFVQGHVHLCQSLFRGLAEDLPLLDWLQRRIWPLEAVHDAETLRASTRAGLAELIDGGVTALLDMGTVHDHEIVCEEILASGIRGITGKAMMDHDPRGLAPARLRESTGDSLERSLELAREFDGAGDGRLRYAMSPRFALSCTRGLLEEVGRVSRGEGFHIHTHGSENRAELDEVVRLTGETNIRYLDRCGNLGNRTVIAHGVHVTEGEIELMASRDGRIAHCPASNLKLGSGIAKIRTMLAAGIHVTLGSDGTPCNNRLDTFREMYLAASLAKLLDGAAALDARRIVELATSEGARALGLEEVCGTLEVGKQADLQVIRPSSLHATPASDPFTTLVYCGSTSWVETVLASGRILKRDGELLSHDLREVAARATEATATLVARAKI